MANYQNLKSAIESVIKANGNNEITGQILQAELLSMITTLGAGYQYVGKATPGTVPGTPDANVFYLASMAGTYANFGNIVVNDGEIAILKYNGTWTKELTGATTSGGGGQLRQEIDVTAPPADYTGAAVSADSTDNTPALYALIAWAVENYKNPVLHFPKGTYTFSTAQMFTLVPGDLMANSIRITGDDANIVYSGGALQALGGWLHIFYQNTEETRHDFSVEIDHLSFSQPNGYADNTHLRYAWIFVQGSQLADVYLDRVSVHDNTFRGQCGAAIQIGYARQCFIERNKLYNCYEATSNDDSGFVIHNNICYNSIIRNNYLYVDDTKPLCGAGIVVEYQTGNAIIEGNYVYGYDRGIHVEITQRRALQRVIGNHVENCFTGIISWNALSDLEIRGNSVLTTENWNYQDRLTYSEKNQAGIWFPTYARNKSVRIIQNTVQLYAGGNPIANTARGTYSGVAVCPHNWEIAYNEFYTDGAKTPYAKMTFWLPIYSKIHHNIWYGWAINPYGANNTEVYENDFFLESFSSSSTVETQSYFTPGGESTGMTVLQYATEKVPGLRGLNLQELFGCRYHHNRFQGLNTKGLAWKSLQGIFYNNEISIRSANIDGTGIPNIINAITLYPNSNSSGVAIDNTVYEYDGVACGAVNYQGVERNVYYSVDGQGNKTLRLDTNKAYYNTNKYTLAETIEPERKLSHNVTCFAPSVTSPTTNWNRGEYIPGDITINSKWQPGSTLPHHWICITAGKGVAGSGETQAVWQPIYDNTTIQKTGGTTSQRPTLASGDIGFTYYDSTLGKTIVWNGTAWVNMDGTALS